MELITNHLDLWTGAVTARSTAGRGASSGKRGKIELTGIKKLRELILELAVRGKLVEQDPSDEPTSVLLERIAEEKTRLVKEGKIKKPKKLPEIAEGEKPFELPEDWDWTRLSDVLRVINGRAYKKHEMLQEGTPLLRVGNLFTSNEWYYSDLQLEDDKYIEHGDLIYAWSASFGPFIWDGERAIYHYHIWKLDLYDSSSINKHFIYNYLKAVTEEIKSSGSGIAMIHMTKAKMEEIVVPFPPLDEQHRIVEKVDELMALCDRLEQQGGDQLEAHEVLVDTLLDALTRSADAAEVAENWARIAEHFDTLFTTDASIDKLKQTILQLAVMGRLVPQDPNDEPASVLLEKIADEKARLVKEGKIKKPNSLPDIEDDERSYQSHQNWAWVRFQDVANEISTGPFGSMIHKHDYVDDGVPLINPSHMINGEILEDSSISVSASKAEELASYKLSSGDIVMARRGEVGRCAIITDREAGWLCGTGSFLLRFHDSLSRRFILMMFATDRVRSYLTGNSVGTTMTNLNHGILNRMPVAVPPASEQHRIVEKVDELIALCDHLKARLGEAGETRTHLAEAVVAQAVS